VINVIKKLIIACSILPILAVGCGWKEEVIISGSTMGTTYQIKIITSYFNSLKGLKEKIDKRLDEINQNMSTYRPDSEISRFNAIQDSQARFRISNDFLNVMQVAQRIYERSDGAWDGTIKPLVNLWGFGNTRNVQQVPIESDIKATLSVVGFQHIHVSAEGYLQKKLGPLTLDLASIAKGYAVDQISRLLKDLGLVHFLVEIGGEVYAAGYRKDGSSWRVGINQPDISAAVTDTYQVVPLHNRAMATSGDYRNYFEVQGHRYSHILDPRTGYPVNNGVVSVSVVADNCMLADGLATAVMVMGHEVGLALIASLDRVEALIIIRNADTTLSNYASNAFGSEPD